MKFRRPSYLWIFRIIGILILTVGMTSPVLADETPAWTIVKDRIGDFAQGDVDKAYTITVTNSGGAQTSGLITVTDTLPTGLIAQTISSLDPAWICPTGDISGLTELTCTRTTVLDSTASSEITVIVDVAVNAGDVGTESTIGNLLYRTVTNTVTVSGGGSLDPATDNEITPILQKPDLRITGYQLINEEKNAVISSPQPDFPFWIRMTIENRGGADTGSFYPGVFLDEKPNYGVDHTDAPLVFGEVTDFSDYRISPANTLDFSEGCLYYDPAGTIDPLTETIMPERGNYTLSSFIPNLQSKTSMSVDVHIAYPDSEADYADPRWDGLRNGLSEGFYNIYLYADPSCTAGQEESYEDNNAYGPISVQIGSVPLTTPWAGGITIESDRDVVAVGRPHVGTQVMTYDGFSSGSLTMYVPMLFKNMWGSYNSALYVQNVNAANTANITIKFYDTNGNLSCTKNDTINALSSKGYWIPSETCLPSSWVGGVVITSNQNIVAVGRPHIGTEVTTYNGFASGSPTMYVPMLFKQAFGSYNSALYVQNVDAVNSATVAIKYYDSNGNLTCTKNDTISKLSSKGYWLPSETCLPVGWVGGVVVTSNRNIVAVGRPHIGTQVTTYSGFAAGGLSMSVPMLFKQAFGTYNSALYVQNIDSVNTASITVKYYDKNGDLSCTNVDTIAPLASKGYWVPSETCLPAGWVGSAQVTSNRNIVSVGRPHLGAEILTYGGFASGNLSNFVPMLFNNMWGSYNAAFYLQNLDAVNPAIVTIKFYDTTGNLTCTRQDVIPTLASLGFWVPSVTCLP